MGRYSALRFQVDPLDPPPRRDARWVLLVLGIALAFMGGLLLIVNAIVDAATWAGGSSCAGGPNGPGCSNPVFEYVLLAPGLALLAVGVILAFFAFFRIVR